MSDDHHWLNQLELLFKMYPNLTPVTGGGLVLQVPFLRAITSLLTAGPAASPPGIWEAWLPGPLLS